MKTNKTMKVVSISAAITILVGAGIFSSMFNYNEPFDNLNKKHVKELQFQSSDSLLGVDVITISVGLFDVNLSNSDSDKVEITSGGEYFAMGLKSDKVDINVTTSSNVLSIVGNNDFIFGMSINNDAYVNISIPLSYTGGIVIKNSSGKFTSTIENTTTYFDINVSSGSMFVSHIDTPTTSIYLSSGSITIENMKVGYAAVNISSGSVKINGEIGALDHNSSSGDASYNLTNTPKDVNAHLTSGSMEIHVEETKDINLILDIISGTFRDRTNTFEKTSYHGDEVIKKGEGSFKLNITIVSGYFELILKNKSK